MKTTQKTDERLNNELETLRMQAAELEKLKNDYKRLTDELREARHESEIRVKVRTAEIAKANEDLHRDIAERKATEEKFRAVINSTPDGFWIIDLEGKFLEVNPAICRLLDYGPQEMSEMKVSDIEAVESAHNVRQHIEKIKESGSDRFETKLRRKDGVIIDVEVSTSFITDSSQEERIFAFVRDITERKATEEALENQEVFLSNVFSSIQDGISILDKEMNIVRVNTVMEEWYAHAAPLVGKKCYEAYHCRKIPCEVCPTTRVLNSGEAAYDVITKIGPGGKNVGWLDLYVFPLFNQQTGQMEGVIEYVRDITKRKHAENELERSEEALRLAFENSTDAILWADPETCLVIKCNKAAEMLLEKPKDEIVWHHFRECHPPEEAQYYEDMFKKHIDSRGNLQHEAEVITKSGKRKPVIITSTMTSVGGKLLVQGIFRDITEQRKSRQELEKLNRDIINSNKKLKQLSVKDSHTGLYNHRYLEEIIEIEFYRAKRYGNPFSAIMLDLDYFKSINDVYGHQFGDLVLKQVAEQLKKGLRRYDVVIRYGGEEFVVLFPVTDRPTALVLAHRLLEAMNLHTFGNKKHEIKLKLSIAVAAYPEDRIVKGMDLIELADQILNRAKESGGNRVYSSLDIKKSKRLFSVKNGKESQGVRFLKDKIDKLNKRANQSLIEAIFAFAKTIELKDKHTGRHVEMTVKYATEVAKKLQLSNDEIENIRQASILHDLGKIGISEKILMKKGKLTKEEFEEIKKHPQIGADIIRPLHFLHNIIPLVLYHHEMWDGKGYPSGLKGEDIPIGARIISVADVYQALTSDRPYRKAFTKSKAIQIIKKDSGSHFDPNVVNAFLGILKKP